MSQSIATVDTAQTPDASSLLESNPKYVLGMLNGGLTQIEVAQRLGLSSLLVHRFAKRHGLTTLLDSNPKQVLDMLQGGLTQTEVAEKLGLPSGVINRFARNNGLPSFDPKQVIDMLTTQNLTQSEVAEKLGLPNGVIHRFSKSHNLTFTRGRKANSKTQFNYDDAMQMVEDGMSMQEVGTHFGVTRERIRQIAKKRGLKPRRAVYNEKKNKIIEDLNNGVPEADIVTRHGVSLAFVVRMRLSTGTKHVDVVARSLASQIERVRAGESIRSVALETDIHPMQLKNYCDKAGVSSKHGRWLPYDYRLERVRALRPIGYTWDEIATLIAEHEGRAITGQGLYAWAGNQFDPEEFDKLKQNHPT